MMCRRPTLRWGIRLCALLWLIPTSSGASPRALFDLELPDLDRRIPAVLDLTRASLTQSKPPGEFATEQTYKEELRRLGDLAFDDANGGMLFVASGRASLLGPVAPSPGDLAKIVEGLKEQDFLSGPALKTGSWLAFRTRGGATTLGKVVSRPAGGIRLRWVSPIGPGETVDQATLDAIASVTEPSVSHVRLPPSGADREVALRLLDGAMIPGPGLGETGVPGRLKMLVDRVRGLGDLAYFRPRSGLVLTGSGRVAALGKGSALAFEGRDLSPRLKEQWILSADQISPENLLLVRTREGLHALLRIDSEGPEGLTVSWQVQTNGTAIFPDLSVLESTRPTLSQAALDASLIEAAIRGDLAEAGRLLLLGADASARAGRDGRSALMHAIIRGDDACMRLLLESGADTGALDDAGWSALHVAARLGKVGLVTALIEAGADSSLMTPTGLDALAIAFASPRQSLALLRVLRHHQPDSDSLALVARVGDAEALETLLRDGADVNEAAADGRTALEVAAESGQMEALRLLLEAGADPSLESPTGQSALMAAVSSRQAEATAAILDHGGSTPEQEAEALVMANHSRNPELARLLLDAGADATRATTDGSSPLDHALRFASAAVVEAYVAAGYPMTVAAAARLGETERLVSLLESGAPPSQSASDGRTPLQYAIENQREETVQILLENGVSADEPFGSWDRRSPLHAAAQPGGRDVVTLLIAHGAAVDRVDRIGRSPLYHAVTLGAEDVVRTLLEGGANPNLAPQGEALVGLTRETGIQELLIDHGARTPKP
ncbi:MAG: hypothetical protein GY910_16370 [bacterium]|nr:hypothetical protein [bacterium]